MILPLASDVHLNPYLVNVTNAQLYILRMIHTEPIVVIDGDGLPVLSDGVSPHPAGDAERARRVWEFLGPLMPGVTFADACARGVRLLAPPYHVSETLSCANLMRRAGARPQEGGT